MTHMDLEHLETTAYQDSISDGLIDLFLGLSLVWFGVVWLWIESWVGQAAAVPAVLAWFAAPMRRRFLKRRIGHVRWTERRRRWERKQLKLLLGFVQLCFFGLS